MGFRFRKRTKGNDSWLNFSGSRRGLKSSASVKFGDLTVNIGKGRVRTTYNFGNGLTYVKTRSTRKKSSLPDNSRWAERFADYLERVSQDTEDKAKEFREKYSIKWQLPYWLRFLIKTISILVFLYVLIVFIFVIL